MVFSAAQSTLPGCGRAVSSSWVRLTVTLLSDLTSVFPGRYQTEILNHEVYRKLETIHIRFL